MQKKIKTTENNLKLDYGKKFPDLSVNMTAQIMVRAQSQ